MKKDSKSPRKKDSVISEMSIGSGSGSVSFQLNQTDEGDIKLTMTTVNESNLTTLFNWFFGDK